MKCLQIHSNVSRCVSCLLYNLYLVAHHVGIPLQGRQETDYLIAQLLRFRLCTEVTQSHFPERGIVEDIGLYAQAALLDEFLDAESFGFGSLLPVAGIDLDTVALQLHSFPLDALYLVVEQSGNGRVLYNNDIVSHLLEQFRLRERVVFRQGNCNTVVGCERGNANEEQEQYVDTGLFHKAYQYLKELPPTNSRNNDVGGISRSDTLTK